LGYHDALIIDDFVKAHIEQWQTKVSKPLRIDKDETGLPRSMVVFKEGDKLQIMVLFKQKGWAKALGKGAPKSAKIAMEWQSGKLYADVIVKSETAIDTFKAFEKECRMLNKLKGPGIAEPFIGRHEYEKNKKMAGFMPLYEGNLESLKEK